MTPIQLTQIQADRWNRYLAGSRKCKGGVRPVMSPERQQEALDLYNQSRSISHVSRVLCMGRDTIKKILRANGVLT